MLEVQEWLSPSEAARELGVTPLRVRQLLSEGRLSHVRTSLGRLLDPADVERLRAERQQARERAAS
jgi:excisionase family DNA binding protein